MLPVTTSRDPANACYFIDVIRSICLSLPETEETTGHGSPDFKVGGKAFATFRINHHCDGLVCLLLIASRETQQMYVSSATEIFFGPSYVGPKGWYGIDLEQGMKWDRVAQLAYEAYCGISPKNLLADAKPLTGVPTQDTVNYRDLDPLYSKENQARLATIRDVCLRYPEVIEADSFGSQNFRAGKKSFCQFTCYSGPALTVCAG